MFTCLGDVAGGAESLQGVLASQTQGLAGGELQFCLQKGRKLHLTTQDEYERETGSGTGGRGSEDLLSQVDSIVIFKIIRGIIVLMRCRVVNGKRAGNTREQLNATSRSTHLQPGLMMYFVFFCNRHML